MNLTRYSLEYVFTLNSVPNIFKDLIRDFFYSKSDLAGIMSMSDDWSTFTKYLRILCKELSGILMSENKLIKINTPVIVVGDIQGHLDDLMQLEKLFFSSFPVIPEKLVFLGKYSALSSLAPFHQRLSTPPQEITVATSRSAWNV